MSPGTLTAAAHPTIDSKPTSSGEAPRETAAPPAPNQTLPIILGIALLIGAAAIAYLALLQLEYSGMGFADADEARGLAIWNGVTAAITAYFGAMAIVSPSRGRMAGATVWAIINVVWGGYQVSQGVTHGSFILALVAFALAGILAFVAWSQRPKPSKAEGVGNG